MKKTVGIYDRWLATLGGGEQVAFAYAQSMRDFGYTVSLLTHVPVDIKKAEEKMGVDLENIAIVLLPQLSSNELSEYTERYDIFVNTSYLDYFPNRSKNGILSVFFPGKIFLTPFEYIKRAVIVPSFSHFFIYPLQFEGFRYDEYKRGQILKWLGTRSSIIFNKDISFCTLQFFCKNMAVSVIDEIRFELDGVAIVPDCIRLNDHKNTVAYSFSLLSTAKKRLSILLPDNPYAKDVALVRMTIVDIRYFLYNVFKKFFPKWEMRLHGGPGVTKLSDLTSYNQIVTISDFSKNWIKKYWGLPSTVLYPPVQTKNFICAKEKKNWIVHVGRFFVTGHNKKQLELIKVFQLLVEKKGLDGWELHFIGSVAEGENHADYFHQCQNLAQGYPVFFHTDVAFPILRDILSKAKIYWHATGLDEDVEKSPILFEHFGITTVEAMASGCVPVVISAGGQKEIVTKKSGFLWKDRAELLENTFQLTQEKKLFQAMQREALDRARYFDTSLFQKRLQVVLHQKQ